AIIGVSGGRDSVALLHFLVKAGWHRLVIVHLNHGLRGRESGQDAMFVRRLAKQHRMEIIVQRTEIAKIADQQKLSTETAARQARDELFHSAAKTHRTRFVFLAHHAEDQAETVLANLLRGTGATGLRGMTDSADAANGMIKLRPLLQVRRAEIDHYIEAERLHFREDSTNATSAHRRNRLRKDALPMLSKVMQRDVTPLLLRTAELAAQDDDCLQDLALHTLNQKAMLEADGSLRIPRDWSTIHPAIQSRIIRHWLVETQQLPFIGRSEILSVMGIFAPEAAAKVNLPGGHHARRKSRKLWIERAKP
ncbi:MAG: tRNA lysidine(34) synthetase TilS, partial [Verrucomicrobiales bacterium]|nr:tRNA lysidine(34) synthetase TilS [Verrucomicrobiales bacterium]